MASCNEPEIVFRYSITHEMCSITHPYIFLYIAGPEKSEIAKYINHCPGFCKSKMALPTGFIAKTITISWEDEEALCDNDIRRFPASLQGEFLRIKRDPTTTIGDRIKSQHTAGRGSYELRTHSLEYHGQISFMAIDHYLATENEDGGREIDVIWRTCYYQNQNTQVEGLVLTIMYVREGNNGNDVCWDFLIYCS
jgi:hypothetical protein